MCICNRQYGKQNKIKNLKMNLSLSLSLSLSLTKYLNMYNPEKFKVQMLKDCPTSGFIVSEELLFFIFHYFTLPEPKDQVSFSDQNWSVLRCCRRRCSCKLFAFSSSSSSELLGQFQLCTKYPCGKGSDCKFFSNEHPHPFPRGDD